MSNEKDDKDTAGPGKEQEEELVIVETDEGGKPLNQDQGLQDDGDEPDDDADEDDDHDDDADDDERHGHAEGDQDETPEAKRERRRTENKAKRIRNRIAAQGRERILQQQAETIADLTARLDKVEGRASRQDLGMLRNSLQQIEAQQADAKRTHAELAKAGDWEGVAEVNEIQLTLREQHRNVTIALQRAAQAADPTRGGNGKDDNAESQPAGRPKPKAIDPVVKAKANAWADKHSWVRDPKANPEEVAIVRAIDTTLANEGYDPKGDEYWAELGKRVRARLPNHYPKKAAANGSGGKNVDNGAGDNKPANRGPKMTPASQTGGGRRALKPNEVYISPARKQAMIDAGAWDDPEKRARMLKSYRAWDKEHSSEAQQ